MSTAEAWKIYLGLEDPDRVIPRARSTRGPARTGDGGDMGWDRYDGGGRWGGNGGGGGGGGRWGGNGNGGGGGRWGGNGGGGGGGGRWGGNGSGGDDGANAPKRRPAILAWYVGPSPAGPEGQPGARVRDGAGAIFDVRPSRSSDPGAMSQRFAGLAKVMQPGGLLVIAGDALPDVDGSLWIRDPLHIARPKDGEAAFLEACGRAAQEAANTLCGGPDGSEVPDF